MTVPSYPEYRLNRSILRLAFPQLAPDIPSLFPSILRAALEAQSNSTVFGAGGQGCGQRSSGHFLLEGKVLSTHTLALKYVPRDPGTWT